jgi:hypothetical protein
VLSVSHFSKTFVISTEMQQTGNKKVIRRWTREIICNTLDYMRITFPFEALTKISFLRIYFFNLFSENLNSPRHSFLRRLWEIWHWQCIFVTFLSLLFPPPNMKIPLLMAIMRILLFNTYLYVQNVKEIL